MHVLRAYVPLLAVPEPDGFYPLNIRYRAAEKENRQPKGILGDVAITKGPYNEPGGAYMFYGTASSYIEFWNDVGLDTRLSITLMCWVQHAGQNGPLFRYGVSMTGVGMVIGFGKLKCHIVERSSQSLPLLTTPEVLPAGGLMLQQVTITTSEITRCISTDILESRTTLAKVIRFKPPARQFLRGLEVTEIGISKRKSRR